MRKKKKGHLKRATLDQGTEGGGIPREDIHAYAARQGAAAEMLMERPDSSSADPEPQEVDQLLEDLEGQSVIDSLASPVEAVEVLIPVGVTLLEDDILLDRLQDVTPVPPRLSVPSIKILF